MQETEWIWTAFNPSSPDARRGEKINLNFYFHIFIKRFYEYHKRLYKTY